MAVPDDHTTVMTALGAVWGKLCSDIGSTRFVWSADGQEADGWVELHDQGKLVTSFGDGTWKLSTHDQSMIEMEFGTSWHTCRLSKGGRFVVERKVLKWNSKKRDCWVVGWPQQEKCPQPLASALGPHWGKLCKDQCTTDNAVRFLWAHDGVEVTGWLEFKVCGVLVTSFCMGTWELCEGGGKVVLLVFGTSQHFCRLQDDDTFVVEAQFWRRSGEQRDCKTRGWLESRGEGGVLSADEEAGSKRQKLVQDASACRRAVGIIGIAGPSGSGKTSLAYEVSKHLNAPVAPVQLDWFFKPELMARDPSHPKWGPNWEKPDGVDFSAFYAELRRIASTLQSVEVMPKELKCRGTNYGLIPRDGIDIVQGTWPEKVLDETPIWIVVEGFLLFYSAELCNMCHVHIWLDADCDTCLQRRYMRDSKSRLNDSSYQEYFAEWFRNCLWAHYELYKEQQLSNAVNAVRLLGSASIETMIKETMDSIQAADLHAASS